MACRCIGFILSHVETATANNHILGALSSALWAGKLPHVVLGAHVAAMPLVCAASPGLLPAVAMQTASQQLLIIHLPDHCLLRLKKAELVMVLQALGVAQLQMQDWGQLPPRRLAQWSQTQPAAPCRRQSRQTPTGLSRPSMQRRWRLPHWMLTSLSQLRGPR